MDNCIFCGIATGKVQSLKIYENERTLQDFLQRCTKLCGFVNNS